MKTQTVLGTLLLGALIIGASAVTTFAITYTTLDDPLAAPGRTIAQGISGSNIVGWYDDSSGGTHGFLYDGSTYTTLDDPLASPSGFTEPRAISGSNIVGDYYDNIGHYHAFLYNGSTYTTLNFPQPVGISGGNIINYAYAYHSDGSIYATLNDPLAGPEGTYALGISGSNIVGYYLDSKDTGHGFLYDGSTFKTLDYPLGAIAADARGISGSNIVGYYYDSTYAAHAYLYNGSTYTTLDGLPETLLTDAGLAIDGNTIAGTYYDELGYHGFVATVPEPSSVVLATLGFLGLFFCSAAQTHTWNAPVVDHFGKERTCVEPKIIGRGQIALAAAFMGLLCSTANAGDYLMVASGPIIGTSPESFSSTFDGTTTTTNTLPPILDVSRLAGGSFRATFRFSTEYTIDDFYDLKPSSGITFDLLDSSGGVVFHGSNFSEPIAILSNNYGGAPYVTDQAALYALGDSPDGLVLPTPLYGPGTVFSNAGLNFSGYVSPGHDYLSDDVNIPTDASTYLAFPTKILDLVVQFEDGDVYQIGPYQNDSFDAQYNITALSVTAVPEPSSDSLLLMAVAVVAVLGWHRSRGPIHISLLSAIEINSTGTG